MLCSVSHSVMLYGAPVWAEAMAVAAYRQALKSVQRKMALRICRAYRIYLMVDERKRVYRRGGGTRQVKAEERGTTVGRWQTEWALGTTGAWTRTLIPDLTRWIGRKHGGTDFYLTQVMTGHGVFKAYTYKIRKTRDDVCMYCENRDMAEHTFFHCARWEEDRRGLYHELGTNLTPENMVQCMLESQEGWDMIHRYVKKVMMAKEADERILEDGRPR